MDEDLYRDNREVRTFCPARYKRSLELPGIIRTLETRRCEFARGERGNINYVTIELASGDRYAAFFDLRRFKKVGPNAVHLTVQSAYVLDPKRTYSTQTNLHRGVAESTSTRCLAMRYAARSPDVHLDSCCAELRNAKPRL